MDIQFAYNPYAFPIFLTSIIFLGLYLLSAKRSNQLGEKYFSYLMVGCFFYSFFYGIELLGTNTSTIKLFYSLEFLGGVFISPLLLLFVLKYSDRSDIINKNWINALFAISGLFLIFVLTNDWHYFFYYEISTKFNGYFTAVAIDPNILHWLYVTYNTLLIITSNILLLRMIFSVPTIYRGQVLIMLLGTFIPWIAYIMMVFGFYPYGLDPFPFFLAISAILLYWALFKYKLFRINPIAFKTIFDNLSDGILIIEEGGEIIAQNRRAQNILDIILPNKKLNSIHQITQSWTELAELFLPVHPKKLVEFYLEKDGRYYMAFLKKITEGEDVNMKSTQYLFFRDITSQKQAEERIRANEQKLQSINTSLLRNEKMLTSIAFATKELLSNADFQKATQKAITILGDGAGADRAYLFENSMDEEGNYFSSQRFEWSAMGVPPEIDNPELQNLPISLFGESMKFLLENEVYFNIVSKIEDEGLKGLLESQGIKSILLIPIFVEKRFYGFVGFDDCQKEREWSEAETALLISFAESISNAVERKNMEQNLRVSMQQANEASVAKSEFLANMSHEIRTPLNGVIGFSDLLMKTKLDETQKEFIQSIMQSGKLLLDLINDILDFSKIEAGKLELSPTKVKLDSLAKETLKLIEPSIDKKNIALKLNITDTIHNTVWVDATRLKQVMINLLSNASKFTQEGEIELSIKNLGASHEGKNIDLEFSVRDTGIGISKEKEKVIFEAFAQEDNSTTRKYGGTGLGLTISNKILQLMESHLELETELGKGSRFFFKISLPIAETEEVPVEEKVTAITEQSEALLHQNSQRAANDILKILLVDDNPVNMLLAKTIVKNLLPGCKILEAKNGREAVELFSNENPSMIFMDIQMPEMSGYEATIAIRQIENNSRRVPIVALTAGTVKGEFERCIEVGMDNYLSKPVVVADIQEVLDKYIGTKKKEDKKVLSRLDEFRKSDPDFFKQLLEVSLQNIEKIKGELAETLKEGNLKTVKQACHALKGVALNLDFKHLAELCASVELFEDLEKESNRSTFEKIQVESDKTMAELKRELEVLK